MFKYFELKPHKQFTCDALHLPFIGVRVMPGVGERGSNTGPTDSTTGRGEQATPTYRKLQINQLLSCQYLLTRDLKMS